MFWFGQIKTLEILKSF